MPTATMATAIMTATKAASTSAIAIQALKPDSVRTRNCVDCGIGPISPASISCAPYHKAAAKPVEAHGLRIGNVEVKGHVLTAPMTGVSDLPFRLAASRLGAAYVATEMVACEMLAKERPDVMRRAAVGEGLPL